MCIRFCFGSWELRSSTQYSVLSTQKNQRTTPLYAESRLASGAHPSNIAKGGQPGAGNPLAKQIEEFTNVYSFLLGCMRSWFPTLSQRARKDGAPRLVGCAGQSQERGPPAGWTSWAWLRQLLLEFPDLGQDSVDVVVRLDASLLIDHPLVRVSKGLRGPERMPALERIAS